MILGRCSRGSAIDFCTALHRASNLELITQEEPQALLLCYLGPFASPVPSYRLSLVAILLHRSKSYSKQPYRSWHSTR
ncbi:hypothetical protein TsFJ059_000218 [Trichoderma semiorbis]|uniref:Uncharacterized protein n=1 Tax=Trichoderma semiorbis TaxID=1491008 RepID=A0A9P8KYK2_9HYPO|nr:hypothetical protein TsFJ059_000218 [Trichoderma semiorbis]